MGSGLLEGQKEVLLLSKCIFFHSNYEQRGILNNKGRMNGVFVEKETCF